MAEYDLTRDDFFSASWFIQRKVRRLILMGGFLFAGGLAFVWRGAGMSFPTAILTGVILGVVFVTLRLLSNRRRILRVYDDHIAAISRFRLTVDEDGMENSHANGSTRVNWSQLKFWAENEKFLFVYQGKDIAQIIPKEGLLEDEEAVIRTKLSGLKRI